MSIERMELVNIAGLLPDLDEVLVKCCESGCFHMETASRAADAKSGFRTLSEENPYAEPLKRLYALARTVRKLQADYGDKSGGKKSEYKLTPVDYSELELNTAEEFSDYIGGLENMFSETAERIRELSVSLSSHEETLKQVEHLKGLDIGMEKIFACEYIAVRIGKLPVDSYPKLSYYDRNTFFFFSFDVDEDYHWGVYFTPRSKATVVDDIFKSLYFERIRISDEVKGTPDKAVEILQRKISEEKAELQSCSSKVESMLRENSTTMCKVYSKLKYKHDIFNLREKVSVVGEKFYMVGFVPAKQAQEFLDRFEELDGVSVAMKPPATDSRLVPPSKLKNSWFSKPFSMFVEMYGLPEYDGINPTGFVALTYTLLFGIMFGDLGQGLVLAILGAIVYKMSGNKLGAIIARAGVSSAIFGLMYGSVFGFEEALDPLYKAVGLQHKPLEVFDSITTILIGAVGIGVCLIISAIIMNVIVGFKKKNYERAIFGNNGIAGLIFYSAVLVGGVSTIVLGKNLFTPAYVIFLIVLPVLCMFFRVPLSNLIHHTPHEREGIGEFIAENFFELFEYMLSYVTNTLSFLRVGGFVLSHAGMMLVVMTLAKGASAGASIIIMIIGNIFVMGLEGLLVGIQVLRLEFYEMFSRFYDGDGHEFRPVGVDYTTEIE